MKFSMSIRTFIMTLLIACIVIASFRPQEKPTLYIIGDSTVRNSNRPQCGWGEMIHLYFDTTRLNISNQAMAGRSTRTFIKEGRWAKVLSALKPGDFVIMQFGHNEGSVPDTSRRGYRGVLRGTGDETKELTWADGSKEVVHSYGWYLKKFCRDAKLKGAVPIIASMIPRNEFREGKVIRASKDFGKWAEEIAREEKVYFIDLNNITSDKYDVWGAEKVAGYFSGDHTHTNEQGAKINAESVTEGLKSLKDCELAKYVKM
jgi:rhamnogalacturonan acetylesterase